MCSCSSSSTRPSNPGRRLGSRVALTVLAAVLLAGGVGVGSAFADEELDYGLEKRRLRAVRFVGNQAFTGDELRSFLGLSGPAWFNPFGEATYQPDQLQQGIDALRALYRREGYHGARVELSRIDRDDQRGDEVVVTLAEGPQTRIGEVQIINPDPLEEEDLRALLRYREGGPAPSRAVDLGADLYRLLDHYISRGYLGAVVRERLIPSDSLVTVRYEIRAGPAYRIRDVNVEGARRTQEGHIRRELRLEPGDRFDARQIALTEADLLDTGWFRDVSFEPAQLDTSQALADLVVRVSERPTGFYEFGLGTGDRERVRLSAAWGDRNLWRSGRSLTLQGRLLGVVEDRFDERGNGQFYLDHQEELLYRSPRVLGSRFDLNLNGFFRKESRPASGVVLERAGLLANTEVYSGRFTTLEVEVGVENVLKLPLDDEVGGDDFFENPRAQTRSLTGVLSRDTRDDLFHPRRGELRQLLVQTAGGPVFGGNNDFHKALASFIRFVPLPGEMTLGLRAQAGWAEPWWDSREDGVPLENRYFAGGSRTVRGYRENSLGPRATEEDFEQVADDRFLANRPTAGGNALLLLNAEWRFPLPLVSRWGIGGAAFVDGGNVWKSWARVNAGQFRLTSDPEGDDPTKATDFRTSYGFGIYYRTVVGPLRLDYGIPLKRGAFEEEDGSMTFDSTHVWHFSLGHAF